MDNIIKARFLKDGEPNGREYSYLTKESVAVGDIVQAETQNGIADLVVTGLNVPEEEVEAFKDRLKYIMGKKPQKYIAIEISYTTDEEDFPEHYGYYDNFKDAKEALERLEKQYNSGELHE